MTVNNIANSQLSTTMTRIATGQRINTAADDAAGLAISERLTAQIRGLDRGTQNAMDMQNLINTAEGGLSNISESLHRIRELTVQAQSGILTDSDRQNIQFEIDQLIDEIDSTTQRTEFNTMRLLDGSFSREDGRGLHTAADASGRGPMVNIGNMSASMLLGPEEYNVVNAMLPPPADSSPLAVVIQPGNTPDDPQFLPNLPGVADIPSIGELPPGTVVRVADPPPPVPPGGDLLNRVDEALMRVSRERSYLGAMSNRFDTTIASNQITNLNLAAARSGIRDADIALEAMNMEQERIMEQARLAAERRQQEQENMPLLALL